MRLVLDTNMVVSRFLWSGAPIQPITTAVGVHIELASSVILIAELARTLQRSKFAARFYRQRLAPFDELLALATVPLAQEPLQGARGRG